ncbi:MAG: NAD-binding protein [Clostridiaceae bacterium]|nr:NAD-binding protein [Clostridiaceae bacterium]
MTILLIIVIVGTAFLGYRLMDRIDLFIQSGGIAESSPGRTNRGALVFGEPDIAGKIQNAGIKCNILTEPNFPEDGFFCALFALSLNDENNLAICCTAKKRDPEIFIIARCNAPALKDSYKALGADRILSGGESVNTLLSELGGTMI